MFYIHRYCTISYSVQLQHRNLHVEYSLSIAWRMFLWQVFSHVFSQVSYSQLKHQSQAGRSFCPLWTHEWVHIITFSLGLAISWLALREIWDFLSLAYTWRLRFSLIFVHQMKTLSMNPISCCRRTHSWSLTQRQTLGVKKALRSVHTWRLRLDLHQHLTLCQCSTFCQCKTSRMGSDPFCAFVFAFPLTQC